MSSTVIFLKCYCCQKSFNKNDLIDVNKSSVKINDENLEIRNLIFDTCFIQIDEMICNYICHGCNNNLVTFHIFKRDMKKYQNFHIYINMLEILHKLEKFLIGLSDLKNVIITQDSIQWSIAIDSSIETEYIVYDTEILDEESCGSQNDQVPVEFLEAEKESLKNEVISSKVIHSDDNEKVMKVEKTFKSEQKPQKQIDSVHKDELKLNSSIKKARNENWQCIPCKTTFNSVKSLKDHLQIQHKNTTEDSSEIQQIENSESTLDNLDARKRKLNTLNDLQKDQIEWIRQKVSQSEISRGKRKIFKCPECNVILSTQASLVRHLRDLHILKNPTDERQILKEQLQKSKVIINTENGTETAWKCLNCKRDRIYKSKQSFKLHYRMNHIRQVKVDSKLIANCRTTIDEAEGTKDVWKCPECSKSFKHRDGLRNHLKSLHPNYVNDSINSNDAFNDSMESQGSEKICNFCDECGVKFISTKHHVKPKTHKECHELFKILAPIIPSYKCEKCRTIFNSEDSLCHHIDIHDNPGHIQLIPTEGLTDFGAQYIQDPKGDADDSYLDEAVWKCGHCPVRYFEENDCIIHQLLLHSVTLNCSIDNREFTGITGLSKFIQHTKNKHPKLIPNISYQCTNCKAEFPSIYKKLAHQKLCSLKQFECDYCSKKYSTKHQLQAHMLFELGITGYSCEKCGKKCKTMSDLRIHYNIHTGLRPYKCSLCDKTFKTPAARSSHMEKHENGYDCEICGTKLANRTLYQRHKKFQHDQEFRDSQYEKNLCNICNKSFLRTTHYNQHMKQHQNS